MQKIGVYSLFADCLFALPALNSFPAAEYRFFTIPVPFSFAPVNHLNSNIMKTEIIRLSKTKAIVQCCIAAASIAAVICFSSRFDFYQLRQFTGRLAQQFMDNILSWDTI